MPLHVDTIPTPLGTATAAVDDAGALARFAFTESVHDVHEWAQAQGAASIDGPGRAAHVAAQVAEWFDGRRTSFDLPLAAQGTAFQHAVWDALCAIPFGEVRTYGDLARSLGRPGAARAVGGANGRNPIALIVPCHRVVSTTGLGGYTGGLAIKRALLAHEGSMRVAWQPNDGQLPLVRDAG